LHGVGKRVNACTEVYRDVSEPRELADAAVLKFGFNKVVGGEIVGDTKGIETVGTDISIKVRGVRKPGESLGLRGCKASGSTAFNGCSQIVRIRTSSKIGIAQKTRASTT
jgi:hypothetical protein